MAEQEKNLNSGNTLDDVYQQNEEALKHPPARDSFGPQGEKTPTPAPPADPKQLDLNNPPAGIHVPGTDKGEEIRKKEGSATRYDVGTTGQANRTAGKSEPENATMGSDSGSVTGDEEMPPA